MLTLAKTCTDSCKQYCNRIYTVPCKRVAKVKNSSGPVLKGSNMARQRRQLKNAIGLDKQNNNFARAGFGELKPRPHS